MSDLPSGTITFLFTDVEGSTPLFQKYPDAMPRAMARHHEILHHAITAQQGHVFQIIGDAFCAAFEDVNNAAQATLDAQRALYHENWQELGALRVRMGLHTGPAEAQGNDYVSSLTLVRAQRFMNAGHGGQMLLSEPTAELIRPRLPEGTTLRDLGVQKLRGLAQPETIYQLVAADLPSDFPPLRVVEMADAQDSSTLLEHLVRNKLVGREAELAQLQQHWNVSQQARAHLLTLSGEPGIGKTRLANELIALAQKEGAMVLRGGCYEYEATTPYLPFVEAFRDWVHRQSAETLKQYLNSTAPEIAKLAPEIESKLGDVGTNPPLSPNEERLRLYDNVARFLQKLAAARGLLLFFDDLHWADQGTLNLLHYLLRHLRNDRVLLLAAYRELELDRTHPLASALVEWNRERLVTRVSLARLSRAHTSALVATLFGQATVSDEFVDVLYSETEGNPFFLEEVIKALIEQGQIYRENNGWGRKELHELAVPQSVKEAIGRRLNRLSEGCVEILRTAATLGKIFRFDELVTVSKQTEDQLLNALDEGTTAQLLRPTANDTFTFTHDKIREVLYEELNPIRRRRLHQRIGEGLETLYAAARAGAETNAKPNAHASDLAYHFAQSGDVEKSLTYSLQAAENAERVFAHDDAVKFYLQAHESAEALQRADALAKIDEHIGDIHNLRGEIAPAVARYEQARTHTSAPAHRAALRVKIGFAYAPLGDTRGMDALQTSLTELDPQTQQAELAFALALIGRYHHYHTHHSKAIEYFEKARAIAEPMDDEKILDSLYSFLSGSYQHTMEYDKSDEWARRNIALGERKHHPGAIALGYEFLAENAFGRGDWDAAIRYALLNREIGIKIGSQARVGWADFAQAVGLHGKGELEQARAAAAEGLEIAQQLGENRLATWLEPQLARIMMDLGDAEGARSYAESGNARSNELGQIVLRTWALHALGYMHLALGELEEAADCYEQCLAIVQDSENRAAPNFFGAFAAETFFKLGILDRAMATAQWALELAESAQTPQFIALALRIKAQILAAQGNEDAAHRAYTQAIATLEQLGSRLDAARAYHLRGQLWKKQGDAARAQEDGERARELFLACGAPIP